MSVDATTAAELTKGGVKYDTGKPRMELIPPEAMRAMGAILAHGAEKYDTHNWRRGMRQTRPIAAALRHIYDWLDGHEVDADSGMHPLWHALTDIAFAVAFVEMRGESAPDDRWRSVLKPPTLPSVDAQRRLHVVGPLPSDTLSSAPPVAVRTTIAQMLQEDGQGTQCDRPECAICYPEEN